MANLSTSYMGLSLSNPIVVASSSLTNTADGIVQCAEAGAAAVVLKSLFEEQIASDVGMSQYNLWLPGHTEAFEYVSKLGMAVGPRDYLQLISQAKSLVKVPIIASLNCISPRWWTDYARQVEVAGADALELNMALMPSDPKRTAEQIESLYSEILEEVKKQVRIPIAVKIGPHFTSLSGTISRLSEKGASALVLFNRFYQMDIDIKKLQLVPGHRLSSGAELSLPLRWVALLAGRVDCDLAISTGVHDGQGVIKGLLAGATVVQVCSALYQKGFAQIGKMLQELEAWMENRKFRALDEFRGRMSQMQSDNPELYERLQYIRALVGLE